jgi:hypothetical protein
MKKLQFCTVIDAPRNVVWGTMLADETYRAWTAPFCEGSYYQGSWEKGQRIRFLTPTGEGMTSIIADNRQHEFLSIQHVGMIRKGPDGAQIEEPVKGPPAFENYTLTSGDGLTEVKVDMDVEPEYEQFMVDAWPKALAKLKSICESRR